MLCQLVGAILREFINELKLKKHNAFLIIISFNSCNYRNALTDKE